MKIAFIGAHGTGKTTFAHELVAGLKKKGINAGFLSEIARKCPFPINEDTTKKSQIWIILNQIIKEMEEEEKYDVLVSDRSVLDGYCYFVNKFGRSKILEPIVISHLRTYGKLIKIPIREGFLKNDKFRSTSKKFQEDIENQFKKLIKAFILKNNFQKNKFQEIKKEDFQDEKILKNIISQIN